LMSIMFQFRHPILNRFKALAGTKRQEVTKRVSTPTVKNSGNSWGIDISHHQYVNWEELVQRNRPGFIFMKATEGATHSDSRYKGYRLKAKEHNIPSGAYHFFTYQSPGNKQAQHFIEQAQLQVGDLFPVLDIEYRKNGGKMPEASYIKAEVAAFCKEIIAHFGLKPIIYCEEAFYREYLGRGYDDYPLWISDLHREPRIRYDFWQYTDKGMVHGIGAIDNNRLREGAELSKYLIR